MQTQVREWPVYYKELLDLGNAESNIGIATLWTYRAELSKSLDKSKYSVIGQLYSKEGINFMLRNILANPKLRYLVLCGNDRSGSGEALIRFFEQGLDQENCIKGVKDARIDKELPLEKLDLLREKVKIIDLRGKVKAQEVEEAINGLEELESFTEPMLFPDRKLLPPKTMPSDHAVFKVRGKKFGEVWLKALDKVMRFGAESKLSDDPYALKEVINLVSVVEEEDPEGMEWPDYFNFSREDFQNYLPQIMTAEMLEGDKYTYGSRMRNLKGVNQIEYMISKLKKKPASKTAVGILWDVSTDTYGQKRPCLNIIQALVQEGKLFFTAYIRSNDIYKAWPMNAMSLRMVQKEIAQAINAELGPITVISCSAHTYDNDWESIENMLEKHFKPQLFCEWDPQGNLVISLEGDEIKVIHLSPQGQPLQEFKSRKARELFELLVKNDVISLTDHALDVGAQLQNAQTALENKLEFNQDTPLNLNKKK